MCIVYIGSSYKCVIEVLCVYGARLMGRVGLEKDWILYTHGVPTTRSYNMMFSDCNSCGKKRKIVLPVFLLQVFSWA